MKKFYLLFFVLCIALISFGQKDFSKTLAGVAIGNEIIPKTTKSSVIKSDVKQQQIVVVEPNKTTFNYSGEPQEFVVPTGVKQVFIEAYGAQGGTAAANSLYGYTNEELGGLGGFASGYLDVTPGESLWIYVGGKGLSGNSGGWNGGGNVPDLESCGKGGGASDIRQGGTSLNDRVIVAGGGGGSEFSGGTGRGGDGGGLIGANGSENWGYDGQGGTQTDGGAGGGSSGWLPSLPGTFGFGGDGVEPVGHQGGGGGGWYGGGAGSPDGNGGGGSSYIELLSDSNTIAGVNEGDGYIVISWEYSCPDDIIVDNDPGECGAIVNYTQPDSWAGATVSQIDNSGLTSGDEFPVGVTVQSFEIVWDGGVPPSTAVAEKSAEIETAPYAVDTCTFTVRVEDTEAPVVNCSGTVGKAAYVSSNTGEPWGVTSNIDAMDMAFGSGNWDHLYYENVDVEILLSEGYNFIFMEGGDDNANEMETFIDANIDEIEDWVSGGGNLFLNAAPNEGDGMNWGFGGVQLLYGGGANSGHVIAANPDHEIFQGPFTPVVLEYTGSSFSHSYIPGPLYTNVLIQDYDDPSKQVLVAALWGEGKVFFGGMTTTNFHSPNPEAFYLRANMLSYLGANAPLEYTLGENGTVSITVEDINGGSTDNCGIDTMYLDKYVFDCGDVGENEVTLTVVDVNGNFSSCKATVTIIDDFAPDLTAKSIEVFLDENGEYTLTAEDVAKISEGTIDNCTAAEDLKIGAYPVDFSCVHVGKEPVVQVVAKDKSGNEAKAWVTITVSDTLAPAIAAVEDVEVETELCDTAVAIDYPEITVNDVCDVDLELIAGLGAGAMFPVGITTETWVATDAAGNADTLSFDVIVTAGNDLPTLDSIADITADEDAEPVVIELDGISYGEDCKEQDLTISAGSLDATLVDSITVTYVTGDSTGTIEIALAPNMNGTAEITVTVEDEAGAEVSQTFMLTVAPVNDAPFVVMPVPDQTVYASYVLEIPVSSVLGELFNDVDDDELEISVMVEGTDSLPAWATMLGDTLVCEPMIADTGCVNIVVMATDTSGATASDTFEVCVDGYPTAVGGFDMENLEVQMYPNPTNGRVNIEISSGLHDIDLSVMDMTGRVVMQKQYSALEKVVFDMSGKVAGMYFVNMNIDGERIIKKLIVDNK